MQHPITALLQQYTILVLACPLTTFAGVVLKPQDTVLVVDTQFLITAIEEPLSISDTILVYAGEAMRSTMTLL